MIGENIISAQKTRNITALGNMLYASTLAGISFSISRLGLVHAMSHPISGYGNVPHGLANAILLPYILEFNLVGSPKKHALVAKELGIREQKSVIDTARNGMEKIIEMNNELEIPKSFKEFKLDTSLINKMIEDTFKSGNVKINARFVTKEDVEKIYLKTIY